MKLFMSTARLVIHLTVDREFFTYYMANQRKVFLDKVYIRVSLSGIT